MSTKKDATKRGERKMPEKKEAIVNYGTYTEESADAEKRELAAGRSFMKLEVGDNYVRFLPPPVGSTSPFVIASQHFFRPNPVAKPVVVNCPRVMEQKPCPICKKADELSKGNKLDQQAAKSLWPRRRIYANVIDRKNERSGPLVLAFGKLLHEDIIAYRKNKAFGDFTHPVTGYDFLIQRSGTGQFDTEYRVMPAERCALGDMSLVSGGAAPGGSALSWIENQADLSKYEIVLSYDEIREAIARAMEGEDSEQEEPTQAPPARQLPRQPQQPPRQPQQQAQRPAPSAAAPRARTMQDDVGAFGDFDDDDIAF